MRLAFALMLCPGALVAQDLPRLAWPLACMPGETCYIQNLVDRDPGPGALDAECLPRTYDGHDGTDIGLATLADQARGVEVRAALPGTVAGRRDGMEDRLQARDGSGPNVAGRECGNGVLLRHADGWETQYCHMAKGSLTVAEGDTVAAGDPLGRVGLSGRTEFPHLHLTVRHEGTVVDPFDPDGARTCGETPAPALWADPVPLPEGGFLGAGLVSAVPEMEAIVAGPPDLAPGPGTPLVLYGYYHGLREGDVIGLRIDTADGVILDTSVRMTDGLARGFRAAGREAPEGGWPAGRYRGTVTLLREGTEVDRAATDLVLP